MKNFIEYFYNIKINTITNNTKYYSFKYQGYNYKLYIYNNDISINFLINLNQRMLKNTLVSEIITNRNNEIISTHNNISYILIKIFVNSNKKITLEEINYLSNSLYITNLKINWSLLWSKKIDYLETLINENGKKYPIIVDSFNYFVGMTENAISYYNTINIPPNYKYVISHKRINTNDTIEILYNPLNIIFDYKVRDIAEYLKYSFFINNKYIFKELNTYLQNNNLSIIDIKLLVSRLLYPSFYFELYEDILINNVNESIILKIIDKLDNYEKYLAKIINNLKSWYDIDEISWLKK